MNNGGPSYFNGSSSFKYIDVEDSRVAKLLTVLVWRGKADCLSNS